MIELARFDACYERGQVGGGRGGDADRVVALSDEDLAVLFGDLDAPLAAAPEKDDFCQRIRSLMSSFLTVRVRCAG
ncbi:hypothetical protein [Streptomyces sp. NRRL F-5126]|uniref:hypothetical protein n=1 Tax=Streptomyces sp. NRRL F-5126 TaxID=1463857 RepID=UPI00131CAE67|nr:hypothetical protein [Streptomyces sp. NRRL F-5126]